MKYRMQITIQRQFHETTYEQIVSAGWVNHSWVGLIDQLRCFPDSLPDYDAPPAATPDQEADRE